MSAIPTQADPCAHDSGNLGERTPASIEAQVVRINSKSCVDDLAEDDFRRNSPRFQGENFQKNLDLVHEIEAMAGEKGCTASQLALAWVLAQGDDVVPIPGTKRRRYLQENAAAVDIAASIAGWGGTDGGTGQSSWRRTDGRRGRRRPCGVQGRTPGDPARSRLSPPAAP